VNKGVVILLANCGWSLTLIAKRFKVSIARISQIVGENRIMEKEINEGKLLCDLCQNPIKVKRCVKIKGVAPFTVCSKCREKLEEAS